MELWIQEFALLLRLLENLPLRAIELEIRLENGEIIRLG